MPVSVRPVAEFSSQIATHRRRKPRPADPAEPDSSESAGPGRTTGMRTPRPAAAVRGRPGVFAEEGCVHCTLLRLLALYCILWKGCVHCKGLSHGRGAEQARGDTRGGATRKTQKPAAAPGPSQAAFAGGGGGE